MIMSIWQSQLYEALPEKLTELIAMLLVSEALTSFPQAYRH